MVYATCAVMGTDMRPWALPGLARIHVPPAEVINPILVRVPTIFDSQSYRVLSKKLLTQWCSFSWYNVVLSIYRMTKSVIMHKVDDFAPVTWETSFESAAMDPRLGIDNGEVPSSLSFLLGWVWWILNVFLNQVLHLFEHCSIQYFEFFGGVGLSKDRYHEN